MEFTAGFITCLLIFVVGSIVNKARARRKESRDAYVPMGGSRRIKDYPTAQDITANEDL